MNKNTLTKILIAAAVVLAVVQYILLPQSAVVQVNFKGEPSNMMPKAAVIAMNSCLIIGGSLYHLKAETGFQKKGLIVSIVGVIAAVSCIAFNCLM